MEKLTFKKNGLIYTDDFKVVVGIDSDSKEFTGTVPNGVTSIEEEAFSCCGLKEISLPDSVDYLGANLFCNCTELESVRLPANLKILPPFLFCGCKSLKKVEMPLEIQDFSEGLFAECASLEEIPFRSGIKTLPENVFDSCSAIKSLIIPDSVTKICANAIANCENLETIVLPAKLETVEKDWISNCPKLKHIRISDENSLFKTDEENCVLYKIVDGEKIPLLTLENKSEESLPGKCFVEFIALSLHMRIEYLLRKMKENGVKLPHHSVRTILRDLQGIKTVEFGDGYSAVKTISRTQKETLKLFHVPEPVSQYRKNIAVPNMIKHARKPH